MDSPALPVDGRKRCMLKVVLLGDTGVGKSSLLNRYVHRGFDPHSLQTVGVEFLKKHIDVGDDHYTLQIWDTAGQERFRSLRTPFFRGTDVCLLVFAVNQRATFDNLVFWLREFAQYGDVDEVSTFPFIVVGNKVDLVDQDEREVSREEAELWCNAHGPYPYVETSAKTAVRVDEAFLLAIEQLRKFNARRERMVFSFSRATNETCRAQRVELKEVRPAEKSSCC